MNNHLKNWLDGVSQALVLYPEQDYLRPRRGDCQNDVAALRGDVAKIAKCPSTNNLNNELSMSILYVWILIQKQQYAKNMSCLILCLTSKLGDCGQRLNHKL